MLPNAGRIKVAMTDLCNRAADLGFLHAEKDLGLQPRTFAREKKTLFPDMERVLDDYVSKRAFYVTGIAKDAILNDARDFIKDFVAKGGDYAKFEEGLFKKLAPFLPETDKAGRRVNKGARLETIIRTNTTDMYNRARYMMYTAPELKGWVTAFRYTAVMDARTTPLCRALHGRIFKPGELNGYIPPNHFNCRSTIVPVTVMDEGWEEEWKAWGKVPKPALPEGFGGPATDFTKAKDGMVLKKQPPKVPLKDLDSAENVAHLRKLEDWAQKELGITVDLGIDMAKGRLDAKLVETFLPDIVEAMHLLMDRYPLQVQKLVEVRIGWELPHKTLAQHGRSPFDDNKSTISFNPRWLMNPLEMDKIYEYSIDMGFHPPVQQGIPYLQATAMHEYGHAVQYDLWKWRDKFFLGVNDSVNISNVEGLFRKIEAKYGQDTSDASKISAYALKDHHIGKEKFAETFASILAPHDQITSQYARDVIELVDLAYDLAAKKDLFERAEVKMLQDAKTKKEFDKMVKELKEWRKGWDLNAPPGYYDAGAYGEIRGRLK